MASPTKKDFRVVATSPPILEMRHIAKRFGSFVAIHDASFNIRRGEIHALVGENGAGKSTLMNILYGMFPRSGGEINFDGKAKNPARPSSEPLLEVQGLTALGERGEVAVNGVSLTVRGGEIVGLAGVQGNGQHELVECIAGLRLPTAGAIHIGGKLVGRAPAANRAIGLAYIPADRGAVGISTQSSNWENLTIGHLDEFRRGPFLAVSAARQQASALITQFDLRGAEPDKLARALSGGNQQKVRIARELTRDARVIVAEQPSQGVDIGAIEQIHRTLVEMRDAGKSVLVISADLDEIFSIAGRILVLYRGRIVAGVPTDRTTTEEVGRYMGGLGSGDAGEGAPT